MLTNCPNCKSLISTKKAGENMCKKCGAIIYIGDPLKDEENKVIVVNPYSDVENEDSETDFTYTDRLKEKLEENSGSDDDSDLDDSDFTYEAPITRKSDEKKKSELKGVPWDRMNEIGIVEAFYQTTRDLIFKPTLFFIDMKFIVERKFIPIYGLIFAAFGVFFEMYWQGVFLEKYLPEVRPALSMMFAPEVIEKLAVAPTQEEILLKLLVGPFFAIVYPALILYFISLLMGAKTELQHYYRLMGFLAFFNVFYSIPVIGFFIALIWKAILIVKGLKVINMFSTEKALITLALFPPMLFAVVLLFSLIMT